MAIKSDDKLKDARVRRTRQALRDSFLRMCMEYPLKKINITDLTADAGVDRRTFYLHYDSFDDVMDDIANGMIRDIRVQFNDENSEKGLSANILIIYRYIDARHDMMSRLLFTPDYSHFAGKFMNDILGSDCFRQFYVDTGIEPYITRGFFNCIFSIYRSWSQSTDSQKKLSLESLAAETAHTLLYGGLIA